jgi:hypothetical protein
MESLLVKLEITLIIIGFVIFSYAEVRAKDWRLYAKTDSYECFYDAEDMIHSSQDIVEVWTRSEYTERGVTEMVKKFGKHYGNLSYSLELWEINCAGKKDRLLSIAAYTAEGYILYTDQAGSRLPPWKIISRKSVEESLYEALCK